MTARTTLLLGWTLVGCGAEPESKPETTPPTSDTAAPDVDTDPPCQLVKWFVDADGDGHGDPYAMVEDCVQPSGYVDNYTDCDDADADAHPGSTWYADTDGDGFGDPATELARCQRPLAHVSNADDCDDSDAGRNPDSVWYVDSDADGFGDPDAAVPSCDTTGAEVPDGTDCDDGDALIHPERVEICDAIDNNCNGLVDDDDDDVDIYTQVMFYRDDDGDDYGTIEELGMFCLSSDPGATVDGDCDDSTAAVHPGRIELPDETDQNCDGESTWQYVDDATTGVWTTGLGSELVVGSATAGDLDGDGDAELILQASTSTDSSGQVMVLSRTVARDFSDAGSGLALWTGDAEGDELGSTVATIFPGDMNGDGTPELLVTSEHAGDGAGVIYLLNGIPASGDISTAATWTWTGPSDSAPIETVAALGDIDADGYDDILVGASDYTGTQTRQGAAWVVSGASVGVSSDLTTGVTLLGDERYTYFGQSLLNAGDMDGDGVSEILVGHSGAPIFVASGRLYRFAATELADAAVSIADAGRYSGAEEDDKIGLENHAIGDFTGDGYADILTVSSNHALDGYAAGTLFLFYGAVTLPDETSTDDADARIGNDLETVTYAGSDRWADDVRTLGDLDGDGAADLMIASSGADLSDAYRNEGTASLFLGGPLSGDHGTLGSADVQFWGIRQNGTRPMVAAGDLDSDGLDDFFIGHAQSGLTLYFHSGALFQ